MVAMSAASSVIAASLMWPSSSAFLALRRLLAGALPGQALECRDLAEELPHRLGPRPDPARARRRVMHDAGLGSQRRAGADRHVIGDPHLPARHDVVPDDGAAGYAGLRSEDATPS